MAASGNSVAIKSFQGVMVSDGLLAKVVEAVKSGEKEARTSGNVKSFEVFYSGFRQNIAIGRIFIIPVKVTNSLKDFPTALLYGTVVHELNLGEEVADLIEKKIGESEFDEYSQLDVQKLKDTLFYDVESEEYRSLILFAPSWSNIREYVTFKFTEDEEKLSNLLRHLIFSAYFNPAVSSAFDALMTTVDTHKLDITDITPKLTYPFLSENPLRAYPDLNKQGGWAKPKIFLTAKTADAITKEILDPQELNVFEALDTALTEATLPETEGMEEVADFKGPSGSNEGNAELPQIEGIGEPVTASKTSNINCTICGEPIQLSPSAAARAKEFGGSPSDYTKIFTTHSQCLIDKRNRETSDLIKSKGAAHDPKTMYPDKEASAKLGARFDYNATECPNCHEAVDGLKMCPNVSVADARAGHQFCDAKVIDTNTKQLWDTEGLENKGKSDRWMGTSRPLTSPMGKPLNSSKKKAEVVSAPAPVAEKAASTWMEDLKKKNPKLYVAYQITGNQPRFALVNMVKALSSLTALNTPEDEKRLAAAKYILRHGKEASVAPFEVPFTNVGPGTAAHDNAEKAIAVKVDTLSAKGELPIGIELDKTGLPVHAHANSVQPKSKLPEYLKANYQKCKHGYYPKGTQCSKCSHPDGHLSEEWSDKVASLLTASFDDEPAAMSSKSKAAADKREVELDKKYANRKKVADVPLTEDSIWSDLMEDFGEAPQVELPSEGKGDGTSSEAEPKSESKPVERAVDNVEKSKEPNENKEEPKVPEAVKVGTVGVKNVKVVADEHKHTCPECKKTLRCNNPKDCPGENVKSALCGSCPEPKVKGFTNRASDVSGDISEAKSEVVSPDTVDLTIKQPTKSVEEAAKVAADFDIGFGELTDETLELAQRLIDTEDEIAYDVAAENGQIFGNVKGMEWFVKAVADEIAGDEDMVLEHLNNAIQPPKEWGEFKDDNDCEHDHVTDDYCDDCGAWLGDGDLQPHLGAAGDEQDESVEMNFGFGDLADAVVSPSHDHDSDESSASDKTANAKQAGNYYELTPAYGRDYKSGKEVKEAWALGKDFEGDFNLGFRPVNIKDIPKPCTVLLRYNRNMSVVAVAVK